MPFHFFFGHAETHKRITGQPTVLQAFFDDLPEVSQVFHGGIMVAIPGRF